MNSFGPLMADIGGLELTPEDRDVLRHPQVGGVLLFARNYGEPGQLRALCAALLALKNPRLLIAVDHEGGRVQRFRMGFTRIPAMRALGRLHDEDPARALREAEKSGETIGRELGACGIDLCLAPVLDRDCGVSKVIGDRAFSDDPKVIAVLARAFFKGLSAAGMAATGKHFPGHGAVALDSHVELPVDRRPLAEIEAADLTPFATLIAAGIASLMMAHVRYSAVDELPASLSRRWIGTILRRRLGFKGAVFCDDLSMGGAAVAGTLEDRARLALEAGCDMIPVCNDRAGLVRLLDALPARPRRAATTRLRRLYFNPAPGASRALQ